MAEAILVDQAKADDRALLLRGLAATAEEELRALLTGFDAEEGDGPEWAEIVDLEAWNARRQAEVDQINRLMGGDGNG